MNHMNMKQLLLLLLAIFSTNADLDLTTEDLFRIVKGMSLSIIAPSPVTENDVTFFLFTRANPQPTLLTKDNLTAVNISKKFKYIVHGWLARYDIPIYTDIKDEYLIKGDYNVIMVDWRRVAAERYSQSAQNTRVVGKIIANHVISLNIPLANVHLVGHSLGGQTVGFAGKAVQNMTGNKVGRITGLDPSGPLFNNAQPTDRIFETDAVFVDIIHTDGKVLGYYGKTGKVDFYPNGGTAVQPGCPFLPPINSVLDILILGVENVICSHLKTCEFFAKSINDATNKGKRCTSYFSYRIGWCLFNQEIVFGENVDLTAPSGMYYLFLI